MTGTLYAYPDWKAPPADGDILLWPDVKSLLDSVRGNSLSLDRAGHVRIQHLPIPELRRELRRWIGHDSAAPLIASGHQVELKHPGVWAKDVLADALARRCDGAAFHIAVDTDAPKHLHLRWPGGVWYITDDPGAAGAEWAQMLTTPTPAHLAAIDADLRRAAETWGFSPMLPAFLQNMRRLGLESSSLTWVLTNAMHALDWELGLGHHALLASPIWMSPPYLAFVHHLLARVDSFAGVYNATLDAYRPQAGIRNPGRPWPNLKLSPDCHEAPFWLDLMEPVERRRACAVRDGSRWALRCRDELFPLDPAADGWEAAQRLGRFLDQHRLRLAPRALTLTMFLRLLACDLFIHGIGGGRYDQVTDRVIAHWLNLAPPAFAVTTATMLFPTSLGQKRVDLAALRRQGHRLRHSLLGDRKRELASRINQLPRRSPQRAELFFQMHRELAEAINGPAWRQWQDRLQSARVLEVQQRDVFNRELFYALQPRQRLLALVDRYRQRIC